VLAVLVMCLVWGSTWLVIQQGLRDLPPLTSAGVRFALAGAIMLLVAPALARREGGARPPRLLVLQQGTLNMALPYSLVYWAETRLHSSLVAILWAVFPLMMAVCAHAWLPGERMRARQWVGMLAGFGGVYLLFQNDLRDAGPQAQGAAALLLLSPLVSALGTTLVKRKGGSVSSALLNRDGMLLGGALLCAAAFVFERGQPVEWSTRAVLSVVYLSAVGTVLAFGLYFWVMRYAPTYQLSLIAYVTPVIAMLLGALLNDEPVGLSTIGGLALILGGVASALLGRRRATAPGSEAEHEAFE
jgi:drug/metabolite transporter (DMT)-like permease